MKTQFLSPNIYPVQQPSGVDLVDLHCGTVLRLNGKHFPVRVRVVSGQVWLTQAGDAEDHLLTQDKEWVLTRRGLALVEAVPDARVQIIR
jgi:hypothetical protein